MIYSVFVGKYSSSSESKNDLKKLNAIGMKGYLFIKGDFYSLKVYSTLNADEAKSVEDALSKKGFVAYQEVNNFRH